MSGVWTLTVIYRINGEKKRISSNETGENYYYVPISS